MIENATFALVDESSGETYTLDEEETEIFQYICHMLQFITSGDEEDDLDNIGLLAEGILERINHIYKSHENEIKAHHEAIKKELEKAKGQAKQDLEKRKDALKDLIEKR